jgi:hypothetical protein
LGLRKGSGPNPDSQQGMFTVRIMLDRTKKQSTTSGSVVPGFIRDLEMPLEESLLDIHMDEVIYPHRGDLGRRRNVVINGSKAASVVEGAVTPSKVTTIVGSQIKGGCMFNFLNLGRNPCHKIFMSCHLYSCCWISDQII